MLVEPEPLRLANISLRALEIFVRVGESGSMTAAAERLGVTQSAVSQAIRTFEEAIGQRLLDRTLRPPVLTLTGTAVLEHATAIVQRLRALERVAWAAGAQQMPLLRLGMADSFAVTAGPALIGRIRHLARAWSVTSGPGETQIDGLLDRRVDFVLTFDTTPVPDACLALPVLSEPCMLVLPADFAGNFTTLPELAAHLDMLRYGRHLHVSRQIETFLEREGVVVPAHYRFETIDAVIAMVAAGLGWAVAPPLSLLKSASLSARLSWRRLPGAPLRRRLLLVGRRDEGDATARLIQHAAITAFTAACLPALRRLLPEVSGDITVGP